MSALGDVPEKDADERVEALYNRIREQFGVDEVPNTFRTMAHKPEFLETLLDMDKAVFEPDLLDSKTKHLIAVAVSAAGGCSYCVHAHSAIAQMLGASEEEVAEAMTVAAVMGAYNNFNKAMGLDLDITP